MDMLVAGRWQSASESLEVRSPFSGAVVAEMPVAERHHVDAAIGGALEGARIMRSLAAHERAKYLEEFANCVDKHVEEIALAITREVGKPMRESRAEAARVVTVLRLSAQEALRLTGEVLALDSAPNGVGSFGFTLKEPSGVVAAITPFNFPASLVALKIGPAIAAGNSVIVKPPEEAPSAALLMAQYALEAGLPPLALSVVCGPGEQVGRQICADQRVRLVTFTGSNNTASDITKVAGPKRMLMELGSNAAIVVLEDADIAAAARASAQDGFVNAGQVCISAQRLIVDRALRDEFVDELLQAVDGLRLGDPMSADTSLGPVISTDAATRIVDWINAAKGDGATILRGGSCEGALVDPSVVIDADRRSQVWREEVFGPVLAIRFVDGPDEAMELANDSRYGLATGVFTRDITKAVAFARSIQAGVVHINHGPNWKSDFMPYGGTADSGFGKEGIHYATEEMTETKTVIIHPTN